MTEDRRATLVNRLRGIYTIPVNDGAGLLDGKDTFTRDFGNQGDLQHFAAQMIEDLEYGLPPDEETTRGLIRTLMKPADPMGIGKVYVVPIRKEAADRIIELTGYS